MKKLLPLIVVTLTVTAWSVGAVDVKENYEKNCAKCHGADGKGQTKTGQKLGVKDYTDPKVQAEMKDDKSFKSLKEGMKEGDKTLMKPFDTLTDEELKALIAYMRKFKK